MTELNVDQSEIAKFESMAERWWDPHGDFKPLHQLNPVRANYIDQRAKVAEKSYLDIGCGGGLLTEAMAQRGAQVSGIDLGQAPLEVAKLHALESGVKIHYEHISAEAVAERQPESFDVVSCLEMLEHVPDPAQTIHACAQIAKPGAHLFFSTINRNPKAYLMAIIGAEYVMHWLPKGTHEYKKFITPSEMGGWIRAAGLELRDVSGFTYNLLTRSFTVSPDDVDVNYIVHAVKPGKSS